GARKSAGRGHEKQVLDRGAHREEEELLLYVAADLVCVDERALRAFVAADGEDDGGEQQVCLPLGDDAIPRVTVGRLLEEGGAKAVLQLPIGDDDHLPRLPVRGGRSPPDGFEQR